MRINNNIGFCSTIIFVIFVIVTSSCKRDKSINNTTTDPNSEIIFNPNLTYGTVTDIEGNVYKTISIGTQTWMAENLKVSHYRNGDPLPEVKDSSTWIDLTEGACSNYDNKPDNGAIYGKLYNWYAVDDNRKIAPAGWHVSTDADWITLSTYLGGDSIAGSKLKETSTNHWRSPNTRANNESGFTAISGGMRLNAFYNIGIYGGWWSFTGSITSSDLCRYILYNDTMIGLLNYVKKFGFSVRCVKDE
jgi:uncharacterized protein (TIGR02145 family)